MKVQASITAQMLDIFVDFMADCADAFAEDACNGFVGAISFGLADCGYTPQERFIQMRVSVDKAYLSGMFYKIKIPPLDVHTQFQCLSSVRV